MARKNPHAAVLGRLGGKGVPAPTRIAAAVRKSAAALGRKGGLASKGKTSAAKKKASAANGKLGGRPRKQAA
jgi:hypothetical protein